MTERELIQQQQELGDSRFLVTRIGQVFLRLRLRGFRLGTAPQATVSCTGSVRRKFCC